MRVFVTGATGMIGTRLVRRLRELDHDVVILTRRPAQAKERWIRGITVVEGDPTRAGGWMKAIDACDAVVNLAGENIFRRRWSEKVKAAIRDSRVQGTKNVVQALARAPRHVAGRRKILVNASAIGYYGPHGDEHLNETAAAGNDFLARVCVDWEDAARAAERSDVRVVLIRTGVVLDRAGGALAKLLPPYKWFLGGTVSSGRQWMSWVHHADVVGLYAFALHNDWVTGPLNATAPQPATNKEFSQALGRALGRPSWLWTPEFVLRLLLGEVAGLVTKGQRVLPTVALSTGYPFQFPGLEGALEDILATPPDANDLTKRGDHHDYRGEPEETDRQADRVDQGHPHRHAHHGDAGRNASQSSDGDAAGGIGR